MGVQLSLIIMNHGKLSLTFSNFNPENVLSNVKRVNKDAIPDVIYGLIRKYPIFYSLLSLRIASLCTDANDNMASFNDDGNGLPVIFQLQGVPFEIQSPRICIPPQILGYSVDNYHIYVKVNENNTLDIFGYDSRIPLFTTIYKAKPTVGKEEISSDVPSTPSSFSEPPKNVDSSIHIDLIDKK